MKFTTKNKYKANKESGVADMFSEMFTVLIVESLNAAALDNLENHPECLEKMVKEAVAEKLSVEDVIKLGFVHGFVHAVDEFRAE